MPPVIEVKNLTKQYRLGALTSLKDTLRHAVAKISGRRDLAWERQRFTALNNVSFSIEEGEVVGIIGHNGAGKSTLLKHLANITQPTNGEVHVRGSVAPLIEVGAGVHPELTGRENIYINGAILGIPKKEINAKIDEIIDFSELSQFIDTPVKRYSSGMTVKLGFSIATSMDADILIVDEVLAVGDLAFQRKCFDRMEDMIKRSGKTVLLVSHNIRQVERICTRVIMLDHGEIYNDGEPRTVTNQFYQQSNARIESYQNRVEGKNFQPITTRDVDLLSLETIDDDGNPKNLFKPGGKLRVRARLKFHKLMQNPEIIIGTHTTDFFYLTASSTAQMNPPLDFEEGVYDLDYVIDQFPLVGGTYCLRCTIFDENRSTVLSEEFLKTFNVSLPENEAVEPPLRKLHIPAKWEVNKI